EVDAFAVILAVARHLDDLTVDRTPLPVHRGQTGIQGAVALVVVGDTPLAFGGRLGRGRRIRSGHDDLRAGVKERRSGFLLHDWVVPGVDPAHVHRTFRAGFLQAQGKGIAQAQLFRNGESGDVADLRVAVHLRPRPGQHARQVLDVFHRAEEMAEVLAVRLKATDVDDVHVRELVGDYLRGIHEAEGSRKDGVEAFTGQ